MKTILVAVDFSGGSRQVIDTALELSRALPSGIVLLNAVAAPIIVSDVAPVVGEAMQFAAEMEKGAKRALRRLESSLRERGAAVESRCVPGGAVPAIVAAAQELDAAYIVMGSHGHSAFYDLVAGSTTNGVLKRSPCPVIVVPTPRKETLTPARLAAAQKRPAPRKKRRT